MVAPLVPPPDAKLNAIANALVELIDDASSVVDGTKYLTDHVSVKRGILLSDLTIAERPAIVISIVSWTNELMASGRHRSEATFNLRVYLDDDFPEEQAVRMMRDFAIAVGSDEDLGERVIQLEARSFRVTAPTQGKLVALDMEIVALYEWLHSTGP